MTPNYFNKTEQNLTLQNLPSVADFQGMNEPKKKLRSHLRSMKRVLSLKKVKSLENQLLENQMVPAVDHSELNVEAGPIRRARIDVQGEMVLRGAKSLLGLPVVSHSDSTQLGEVRDLVFCHQTNEVLAFVIGDKCDELGKTSIVPWSEICSVEKLRIVVYRPSSRMTLRDYPRALQAAGRRHLLLGTQVLDSEGHYLRMLSDMCIDECSGCIVGYEESGNFIADSLQDKKLG